MESEPIREVCRTLVSCQKTLERTQPNTQIPERHMHIVVNRSQNSVASIVFECKCMCVYVSNDAYMHAYVVFVVCAESRAENRWCLQSLCSVRNFGNIPVLWCFSHVYIYIIDSELTSYPWNIPEILTATETPMHKHPPTHTPTHPDTCCAYYRWNQILLKVPPSELILALVRPHPHCLQRPPRLAYGR